MQDSERSAPAPEDPNAQEHGNFTLQRKTSQMLSTKRLRDVQRSRAQRHLAEALQEGASAAVLRNALVAAEQANCTITDSAVAALARGSRLDLDGAVASSLATDKPSASLTEDYAKSEEPEAAILRKAAVQDMVAASSFAALREAVYAARAAGVSIRVLEPFEKKLAAAVRTQQALESALIVRDIPAIRRAVERHNDGMLDPVQLDRAKAMLADDDRMLRVRHHLWTVMLEATSLDVKSASMEQLLEKKKQFEDVLAEASAAGLLEQEVTALDADRRRVHNAIETRRGAVRVQCRIRPLSATEAAAREQVAVYCRDAFNIEVLVQSRLEGDVSPCHTHSRLQSPRSESDLGGAFAFDSCWAPGTQEEVFEGMRDLVQSVIDGYNVTVFAYGQTGAGKTHTMYGSLEVPKAVAEKSSFPIPFRPVGRVQQPDTEELRGICPRTTEEVFRIVDRDSGRFSFTVSFSMVELYCQRFIDLLDPSSDRPLKVRTMQNGEVFLENAQEKVVRCPADVEPLVRAGLAGRHVRSTALNAKSSRSHVLFVLKITSVNHKTRQMTRGKITLVDLAGSERVKRSDVSGPGLKEAIEVNRSLTALADVVGALSRGDKHVPYRNHELTQVMHDALGGDAKTLMLVNLSPLACHGEETLCSVKFARRVKGAMSHDPRRSRPELSTPLTAR